MDARTRGYIAVVATASVAIAVVLAIPGLGEMGAIDAALATIAFAATWAPLRFRRAGETHGMTIEDAVGAAFLLGPHPEIAPLVLVVTTALARLLMRHPPEKLAFSIAPVGLGMAAALAVAETLGVAGDPLAPRSVLVVGLALAVYAAVSFLVTAELFRRLSGVTFAEMLEDVLGPNVVTWGTNLIVGLLLALVARSDVRGVWLVALLALAAQVGYRAYSRQVEDRRRAEQLATLSRSLASVAAGAMPVERWLGDVAHLLGADAAVLIGPDGTTHVNGTAPRTVVDTVVTAPPGTAQISGAELLTVRASDASHGGGSLGVWRRRGFEPWNASDRHLLEALAHEAVVALQNAQLFLAIERERARWQEESSRLNDILSAASDGIAMVASDGTIVSWNPGMTALSGVDADQATGKSWWTVLRLRDVDGEDLLPEGDHVVSAALSGERHAEPVALQALRRDGQWRWLRATFSPLLAEDGSVAGTVVVARDVTAETEAEGLKADFVATVSHELRTPLTPLKGFVATLRQRGDELTADQTELMYGSMEAQVMRLERLVGDLLVVADLERGRLVVGHELVDLRRAVEVAIEDEADGSPDRISLTGDMALTAAADGAAVVRILRALISNALKHTDGAVEIELVRDGRSPVVRVRDEGPGIPPWEQDRIFRRFHRLGDHLLRTQGPGLGLSIARALADRLGGSIDIASDLGHGATFTLRLRAATPMPVPARPTFSDAG